MYDFRETQRRKFPASRWPPPLLHQERVKATERSQELEREAMLLPQAAIAEEDEEDEEEVEQAMSEALVSVVTI